MLFLAATTVHNFFLQQSTELGFIISPSPEQLAAE